MDNGSTIINILSDKPVAYHPDLARMFGGVKSAVFLCQLLYWTGKGTREDGFIWKTQAEIERETGLTRSEQETARRNLIEAGVLEEKLAGIPARLHYRLNVEKLQTSVQEYYEQVCKFPANSDAEKQQAIPEITTEYTENTDMVDAKASTPAGQQRQGRAPPKESPLSPKTPEQRKVFARLWANAKAKKRKGPTRFPSLEAMEKFDKAVSILNGNGEFDAALTKALEQGITSVVGVTNYVARWAENLKKTTAPIVIKQ